ncbi:conserved hypothetical protein [Streptomyces sp. SPB78]|uniref:RNA polymerase sigma factor n=1 Tax=Streptomyces sp. (strain SPB78) TaxID=591157 RepID=UPI0001B54A2A|nr:sigma-70 family RNA polymerase sigma factor [Streptomyces sp. SPB78]EFL04314.1 conserved hypothetical protein [Streptomyces sp. SPB78]
MRDRTQLSPSEAARLDRLFRLHHRTVLALAATVCRRPADAEDVAGETWLRASRSIHQLRVEPEQAAPWLTTMVRRAAIDLYRLRRTSEELSDWSDPVTARIVPPAEAPEGDVLALAELTPHQATVWRLLATGLSERHIARRLGRSQHAVWKRKHAGARRLRAAVKAGC